ncbi:hypothetical protein [Vreelandella sp. EE22]
MAGFVVGIASVVTKVTTQRPGREEEEFYAEIRIHDRDEQDALNKRQEDGEITGKEIMRADLLAITGLQDGDGKAVDAPPEMIDKMFNDPYAGNGIMRAWHRVQNGLPEETAKN